MKESGADFLFFSFVTSENFSHLKFDNSVGPKGGRKKPKKKVRGHLTKPALWSESGRLSRSKRESAFKERSQAPFTAVSLKKRRALMKGNTRSEH